MRPPRSPRRLYRRCPPLFSSARPRSARREAGNRSGARRPRFPVALRGPGLTRVSPPSAAAGARGDDAGASRAQRHHAAARPRPVTVETRGVGPAPLVPLQPRDCCVGHAPHSAGPLRVTWPAGATASGDTGGGTGTGPIGTAALPPPPRHPDHPTAPSRPRSGRPDSAWVNPGPDFGGDIAAARPRNRPHPPAVHSPEPCARRGEGVSGVPLPAGLP